MTHGDTESLVYSGCRKCQNEPVFIAVSFCITSVYKIAVTVRDGKAE